MVRNAKVESESINLYEISVGLHGPHFGLLSNLIIALAFLCTAIINITAFTIKVLYLLGPNWASHIKLNGV